MALIAKQSLCKWRTHSRLQEDRAYRLATAGSGSHRRFLSGLKERLLALQLFAEFARTYKEEVTAAAREQGAAHARAARSVADCDKRIAGVVQAIRTGSTARR